MDFNELLEALRRLLLTLNSAEAEGIDISQPASSVAIHDYQDQRREYHKRHVVRALENVKKGKSCLRALEDYEDRNRPMVSQIRDEIDSLTIENASGWKDSVNKIQDLAESIRMPPSAAKIERVKLPEDIAGEVNADIAEMECCFNANCYRSAVILCGRILETALHRKYYEATGKDILETNPGIGLGNLIAKLSEKGVKFDPGLTQQIHLINQVRISSVHKKKDVFVPSASQAQAMILYTIDILKKLFV